MTLVATVGYVASAASAMRAAGAATRRDADVVAVLLLSTVAGLGGGTLRDLLIGARVFWLHDQGYLAACGASVTLVALLGTGRSVKLLLDVADAIGLGAWAVAGSLVASGAGVCPGAAVAIGAMSATWGGLLCEMMAGEPTVLARRELYVTAALIASIVFVVAASAGMPAIAAALLGCVSGTSLRLLAIQRSMEVPALSRFRLATPRSGNSRLCQELRQQCEDRSLRPWDVT